MTIDERLDWLISIEKCTDNLATKDVREMIAHHAIAIRNSIELDYKDIKIMQEIQDERLSQDKEWKEQNHHPFKWMNILMEEVGEASEALLEGSLLKYRDELIQVAAVAVAAIECIERGKWKKQEESEKYTELIMAVVSKYPGETRHETALRYIKERENVRTGEGNKESEKCE